MARKQWTAKRHLTTNNLRVLRAMFRLSQEDVAARIGLQSKFKYWRIENEEAEPTPQQVRKLCKLFRCSAEEIFPKRFKAVS